MLYKKMAHLFTASSTRKNKEEEDEHPVRISKNLSLKALHTPPL
jgi:hypothetical protein